MSYPIGTFSKSGTLAPNDDQVRGFCWWLHDTYWNKNGHRSITTANIAFQQKYGYKMKATLKQYMAVKYYIKRLNEFAKEGCDLPPFKEHVPPVGARTRAITNIINMKKKRGRPVKNKPPQSR